MHVCVFTCVKYELQHRLLDLAVPDLNIIIGKNPNICQPNRGIGRPFRLTELQHT